MKLIDKAAAEIHMLERQLEEARGNYKECRYVMGDIVEKWDEFYKGLPDGEYKGLGELRLLMGLVRKNYAAILVRKS